MASSPPPHTCWASADEWRPGFVMFGANVRSIPVPPPLSEPVVGVDGFWGAHEWTIYPQPYRLKFPYLAWISLPRSRSALSVLTRPVEKTMWQPHPQKSDCHLINPDLFDELTIKWESIKAAFADSLDGISSEPALFSVERPRKAYTRAFEALSRLEKDFRAWRDFVEVFRNLQRSLLELSAFLDWWKDVRTGTSFETPIRGPTRGAIFEDEQLYANHVRWSVASYLLLPKPNFVLDRSKEVRLSPRDLCSAQPISLQPLVHSLHHWYYPPLMDNVVADLEISARGYLERSDIFRPTREFKRTLDKAEIKKDEEAGRKAKKAKIESAKHTMLSNHPEIRRLSAAGNAPNWFPKTQEVWRSAMNHVSHLDLTPLTERRRFSLPPIQLFWGGNEENQRIFYFHFLLLRREIQERCTRDLPSLTTDEWRSILGNTYWKQCWPSRDNSSLDTTFDPTLFWKHGGPLFFGDTLSADVAAGHHDPSSLLPCRCDVQMSTADDPQIRQVILYHLNSRHVYEEVKEMERLQFKTTFEKRWRSQEIEVNHIVEMWDPSGGGTDFKFFHNKKVWRTWLWAVREVVKDWDGFDSWDWG